ncbi:MAG: ATP-binding protein [Elusimicrobiales bacterium]
MKTSFRLGIIILGAALAPALVLYFCASRTGLELRYVLALAAAAAIFASITGTGLIMAGITLPLSKAGASIKKFISGGYKLESPIPKAGWPEARDLVSSLNRVLLELNAFRSFQINQAIEERAKAEALLETIMDGVLLVDDGARMIHCNRRALELLGLPETGAVILPDSAGQKEFIEPLRELLASGEKTARVDISIRTEGEEEGAQRSFRLLSRQFLLATFKRPGRVIIIRDVSLEKEIEGARETFFHMITHDMRAPICSIQGYTELMQKHGAASPDSTRYLDAIMRSSDRLKGMVEDILNMIKLERGEMRLTPVSIDGGELCARMLELHQPLAERRKITLSVPPSEGKVVFNGDLALLERVVANLVGNALKFTPTGGTVVFSCHAKGSDALFKVKDSGPGVPEAMREEIFKKHVQQEEHKHMGFGLGLAMCRMAVELHGGRIWADAAAERGAVFAFTIPLKDACNA